MKKTNAMRILDSKKISYDEIEYDTSKGISGVDVKYRLKSCKCLQDTSYIFKR